MEDLPVPSKAPGFSQIHQRKGSATAVELTDERGRRKTVQLDLLNDADRELAEKFGYKPVRFLSPTWEYTNHVKGFQTRVWIPSHLFIRRKHQWIVRHDCNDLLLS
jgi:hypothetical protein